MHVHFSSPIQLAEDYYSRLEASSEDTTFSVLRDLCQRLEHAKRNRIENPTITVATVLVTNFLGHILEDITRAVPWDDSGNLKATRTAALSLAKTAISLLREAEPEGGYSIYFFEKMGKLFLQYESILGSLNEGDRRLLQEVKRND